MLTDPAPSPGAPLPWYQVWLKAVTDPRVATYEDLVSRPGVSLGRACVWVAIVGALGAAISLGFVIAFGSLGALSQPVDQGMDSFGPLGGTALLFVCLVPVAGIFSILGLLVSAGISQLLARALGGTGTYEQLAYAIAAYTSPISIVTSGISFIPCVGGLVGLVLSGYLIFLNVLAIKSVHHLSWGRAVISSVAFLAIVLAVLACGVIIALALMGPAIGDVFSGIITEI